MVDEVMFSSNKSDWETPDWLFNRLNGEFAFTCDVCATVDNAKVYNFISPELNALEMNWTGTCWCNPPYGREIGKWVAYAKHQADIGNAQVVCLIPARTDTSWWWEIVRHGEVRFLKGRLKFKGAAHSAPFPSAIVIFRKLMRYGHGTTIYWDIEEKDSDV